MQKTGKIRKTIIGMLKQLFAHHLPISCLEIFPSDSKLNSCLCYAVVYKRINQPGHHEFAIFNPFKTE